MSDLSVEYLGYIAPEYASIDNEKFNALNDIANEFVNDKVFGAKTRYARALYLAHILKLGERGDNSGAVISEKVSDISRQYQSVNINADGLKETHYGRQYLVVRRSVVRTPLF